MDEITVTAEPPEAEDPPSSPRRVPRRWIVAAAVASGAVLFGLGALVGAALDGDSDPAPERPAGPAEPADCQPAAAGEATVCPKDVIAIPMQGPPITMPGPTSSDAGS